MSGRNYTAELRAAKRAGHKIVVATSPYRGQEVAYAPRRAGDPLPWKIKGAPNPSGFRFNGREVMIAKDEDHETDQSHDGQAADE